MSEDVLEFGGHWLCGLSVEWFACRYVESSADGVPSCLVFFGGLESFAFDGYDVQHFRALDFLDVL